MIAFTCHQRYYIYTEVTDIRKGVHGLSGLVRNEMDADPMNGDVFVFFNPTRQLMKMLVWDQNGYAIYSKRLESGTFNCIMDKTKGTHYKIEYNHLNMLLSLSMLGVQQKAPYI